MKQRVTFLQTGPSRVAAVPEEEARMIKTAAAGPASQIPFKRNKRSALLERAGQISAAKPIVQQKQEAMLRALSLWAKIEAEKVVSEMEQEDVTLP